MLRSSRIALTLLLLSTLSSTASGPAAPSGSYTLSWSDDFNAPDGTTPDPSRWTLETGGKGWGNNELEYYTTRPENAHIEGGNLAIIARQENYTGPDGVNRPYTSARLKTAGKFSQKYGRFEARIKLPKGQGIWPAFWLLGDDVATAGWPKCGEIDIMESLGQAPSTIFGTLHGPGYSGNHALSTKFHLPAGQSFSDDFHLYAVEWEPKAIRFYVDNTLYETRTPDGLPPGSPWAFDHPFFIILNVAVGGNLPGPPDRSTTFPQKMLVDYVRVYSR